MKYSRETYVLQSLWEDIYYTWYVSSIDFVNEKKIFLLFNKENSSIEKAYLDPSLPKQLGQDVLIWDEVQYRKEDKRIFLTQRLPRTNMLARLKSERSSASWPRSKKLGIVANVDIGIIVASAITPSFHVNFIDKYIILLQYSGIPPLICITKHDLYQLEDPILEWYQKELWVDVVYCSVKTGQGIDELKSKILWKTTVLVWNSGVGKSSLINTLVGIHQTLTQEVSTKSGQWKHTTTSSQWYQRADDSYIIDTPGIRSLELLEIKKDQLKNYFQDFVALSLACKYKDCTHTHEPACAIKKWIIDGVLSPHRYDNYLRIFHRLA